MLLPGHREPGALDLMGDLELIARVIALVMIAVGALGIYVIRHARARAGLDNN